MKMMKYEAAPPTAKTCTIMKMLFHIQLPLIDIARRITFTGLLHYVEYDARVSSRR